MNTLSKKRINSRNRAKKVRAKLTSSPGRPRLSVHFSNLQGIAQVIDDNKGITLVHASTLSVKQTGTMTQKATWLGTEIAAQAKKAKVTKVSFDRGSRKYHGRIKALADAARAGGMEF
jgi:large subunit ribosomal protein L18